MKRCLIFFSTFLFAFGTAPGQQEPVTFTSNTTLVIIDVSPKDKDGKIIENLKKNDVTLTEDYSGETCPRRWLITFPPRSQRNRAQRNPSSVIGTGVWWRCCSTSAPWIFPNKSAFRKPPSILFART